jgi:hypothetical protein
MASELPFSDEELLKYFKYENGKLFWKISKGKIRCGNEVGAVHQSSVGKFYRRFSWNKKFYYVHRLIYRIFNPEISTNLVIDHINGNSLDNRIENLRLTTQVVNGKNSKIRKTNKSGTTAVSFDKSRGKWVVRLHKNGKYKFLGRFENKIDAIKKSEEEYKEFWKSLEAEITDEK